MGRFSYFSEFIPESFRTRREWVRSFWGDLSAGLSVGVIALPLALAFAIASGVPPERGLFTVVVGGVLVSLFGGSRVQIGGPTGAYIVLIYTTVQKHGYEGLQVATFVAGLLITLFALLKLGRWMKYVPRSVIRGFTAGIALIIMASQVKDFLGLKVSGVPANFFDKCGLFCEKAHTFSPATLFVSSLTVVALLVMKKVSPRLPGVLLALIGVTFITSFLGVPVETIGGRFGVLPSPIPNWSPPLFSWAMISKTFPEAIPIAFLGALESLLSAAIGDEMLKRKGSPFRPNAELLGQGIANIVTPLFGGIPATGGIVRTSANVRMGGTTPLAGMIHALTLVVLVFVLAPWTVMVPLPALAGVIMFIAWNMGEFPRLFHSKKWGETFVVLTTLLLTVIYDLVLGVAIGVAISTLLYFFNLSDRNSTHQ